MRSLLFVRLSILFVFVSTASVSSLHAQREETLYYKNGQKKSVSTFNDEGVLHGRFTSWDQNGTKLAEVLYRLGKKENYTTYYENGQKKETITYNDEGDRHGLTTYWDENGNKGSQAQYDRGVLHGLFTHWYADGTKRTETQYRLGTVHGLSRYFHRSGTIRSQFTYADGVLADKWHIECDEFKRCNKIFRDTLRTNNNGWKVANNKDYRAEFTTEGLLLESKKGGVHRDQIHLPIDIERDFSIEAAFEFKKGEKKAVYGLLFGLTDWRNKFLSLIRANGFYQIERTFDGLTLRLTNFIPSRYIRKSKSQNLVKVNKVGDQLVYSVNGRILESEEFSGFTGNYVGIYLKGEQTLLFKHLEVKVAEPYPADSGVSPYRIADVDWTGNGSGVVISTSGIIATNYHVIEGASAIGVELIRDGVSTSYSAELRTFDKQNDLALIQVVDPKYQPFESVRFKFDTRLADVGTGVFTLGYPWVLAGMGKEVKFTDGKISSKTGFQGGITTYQVTVPVQPGNSGGPLFDDQGNLVAIISSKIDPAENVTYAIKSSYLKSLVDVVEPPIELPHDDSLSGLPLTDQIKVLSEYVALILVR